MRKKSSNAEFFYYEDLNEIDREIIDILRELCSDFMPYNYLKKYDLYKGSLFGGTNVYFKRGVDGRNGMITTKSNTRIYNLEQFPYNFNSERDRSGRPECGWSGTVLLDVVKYLRSFKP